MPNRSLRLSQPGLFMITEKTTTLYRPRDEPGEAKAPDRTAPTTSVVLAWTKTKTPCKSLHLRPFVVGLKAQAHRPRLGGLILRPSAECE
jgi:hypothetical protein